MGNDAWKQFERRVARDHGVERRPNTGERDGSDLMEHPRYVVSCKLRDSVPKSVRGWMDAIVRCGKKYRKVPVLIMKEPGKRDDTALVVLQYRDWLALQDGVYALEQLAGMNNALEPAPVLEPAQPAVADVESL